MCIYEDYNKVLEEGSFKEICAFMDKNCKQDTVYSCPKLCGGCDYLGALDDKLKELTRECIK